MRPGVYKIDGCYYKLGYKDPGIFHSENKGLWRAIKVEWRTDHWHILDDLDYLITDDRRLVAVEIGWERRREIISHNNHPPN